MPMTRARSCYEILGVSRTATPSEIRLAYLRLMKRYHPDAATREARGSDLAPLLNRCYAILRDPAKRSQYDAKLQRLSSSAGNVPQLYRSSPTANHNDRRLRAALICAGGMIALVAIVVEALPDRTGSDVIASLVGWPPASPIPAAETAKATLPDRAVERRIARLAQTLSITEAEQFSRQCFAAASRLRTLRSVDACVLFDAAFLYWRANPGAIAAFPAYFADQVVTNRHRQVIEAYGGGVEARLSALQHRAFAALVEGLGEDSATANSAGLGVSTSANGLSDNRAAEDWMSQSGSADEAPEAKTTGLSEEDR
jgi:curved DNA-binding protein CbpA